jgi:glucokinase
MSRPDRSGALGIDIGGTKIAAGVVSVPDGQVLARAGTRTLPHRGGQAVLEDVLRVARSLKETAAGQRVRLCGIGVGLPELVDLQGGIASRATLDWQSGQVLDAFQEILPTCFEADVRSAALAEARLGAGRGQRCFLYVTIGTGISCCLVLDGRPYTGARGFAGTMASQRSLVADPLGHLVTALPLEHFASGPALAARYRIARPDFAGSGSAVTTLAAQRDPAAIEVVGSAGRALGAAIGHLVNVLDPESVILGGGLGLAGGLFQQEIEASARKHLWSPVARQLPFHIAATGPDAGLIGAALRAVESFS